MKKSVLVRGMAVLCLSACALTPEQLAQRQQQERLAQQALAASLAEQCDPEAAALMRLQAADASFFTAGATQTQAAAYRKKLNNPLFQSCYRLAWENYLNQARLEAVQQMQMRYEADALFYPMWCTGYRYGQPYHYRCGW